MNPSNLSLRQKSRGTVVKTIAIHLYGARDPNYIVDLTLSNLVSRTQPPHPYGKVRLVTIDAFLGLRGNLGYATSAIGRLKFV